MIRHIKFPQGQIKRLSASVLLDHIVKVEGGKRTVEPPAPERLRAIKDIVSAAVGFQQERGDQVIVESLPFETTRNLPPLGVTAPPPTRPRLVLPQAIPDWVRVPLEGHVNWLLDQNWLPALVLFLVGGLLYGLYWMLTRLGSKIGHGFGAMFRGIKSKLPFGKKKKGQHVDVTLDPSVEGGAEAPQLEAGKPEAVQGPRTLEEQMRDREELQEKLTQNALKQLELPKAEVRRVDVLTRHAMEFAQKDSEAVANVIRTWTTPVEED